MPVAMLYVKTVNSKVMNATKIISLSSNLRFLTELEMINKPTETRAGAVTHPAVKIEKIGKMNDDNKNIPAAVKAARPVLAPISIPTLLSAKLVSVDVPIGAHKSAPVASANTARR